MGGERLSVCLRWFGSFPISGAFQVLLIGFENAELSVSKANVALSSDEAPYQPHAYLTADSSLLECHPLGNHLSSFTIFKASFSHTHGSDAIPENTCGVESHHN